MNAVAVKRRVGSKSSASSRVKKGSKQKTMAFKKHPTHYGKILKALRKRADVSSATCAKALGLKGPTGYARYENNPPYDKEPIPYSVMEAIMPLLVGRGVPPVTEDELWAICEVRGLKGLLPKVAGMVREAPKPDIPAQTWAPATLTTKYRAESGVFTADVGGVRQYASAPILLMPDYPPQSQFAVTVGDDHAKHMGIRAGAYLHCVEPTSVEAGNIVVAVRERQVSRKL